jgi:hypothetical protein
MRVAVAFEAYLASRAIRFPGAVRRKATAAASPLSQWPARTPLFVGRDGERITRGTLQARVKRGVQTCRGSDRRRSSKAAASIPRRGRGARWYHSRDRC